MLSLLPGTIISSILTVNKELEFLEADLEQGISRQGSAHP